MFSLQNILGDSGDNMFLHPFCCGISIYSHLKAGTPVKCQRFNPQSQGVLSKLAGLGNNSFSR